MISQMPDTLGGQVGRQSKEKTTVYIDETQHHAHMHTTRRAKLQITGDLEFCKAHTKHQNTMGGAAFQF